MTVSVRDLQNDVQDHASMADSKPLRVVSISHSAVRAGAARKRYEVLASDPSLDLTLVVPEVWHEAGQAEHADPSRTRLKVRVQPARLTRGGPAKWYLHHYPGLRGVLRELQPDVIHLWEEPWSIVALQALRLRDSIAPQAALVLETDQNTLRKLPIGFEQIRRHTLARTDLLIARGEEALGVSQSCGYTGASEFVMYGVDSATFFPRERPARKTGVFQLGYVGRLVVEKGLDDVLMALHHCRAPVEFTMLGAGPERAGLLERAAALGLADRVRILEPRSPTGVGEFMSSLDALVLMSRTMPTWKEQFGRVIMEAHACGVPVIGSSSGSIPWVVGHGGWIVEEGNAVELAGLLDTLVDAPDQVAATGELGTLEVERRFSFRIVSEDLRRAWARAAGIRRQARA